MSILRMNLEPGAPTNFSGEFEPVRADSVVAADAPSFVVGDETPTTGEDANPPNE